MDTVKTKMGEFEVKQAGLGETSAPIAATRPNKHKGEVEIKNPRTDAKVRMRPTFEAALEIENALGGLESLVMRARVGHLPGIGSLKLEELGVIVAAGARAVGDERATPESAAKFVYSVGHDNVREAVHAFLYALTHGGQLRVDDLGNGASPSASLGDSGEAETTALMTEIASRSDASSE